MGQKHSCCVSSVRNVQGELDAVAACTFASEHQVLFDMEYAGKNTSLVTHFACEHFHLNLNRQAVISFHVWPSASCSSIEFPRASRCLGITKTPRVPSDP